MRLSLHCFDPFNRYDRSEKSPEFLYCLRLYRSPSWDRRPCRRTLHSMPVILTKKVCSCSAADERIESRLCTGAATDISCFINGYPTGDFNGRGQKQNCGYWIPRASAGSWKGFGSSRKRLSAKENRGIYSDKMFRKLHIFLYFYLPLWYNESR